MEGVTTAIVGFIFVCVIYPDLVKVKPQYYAAIACILLVILFSSLTRIVGNDKFAAVAGGLDGLLQFAAILLLILGCGGKTISGLASDVGQTIDVIRRGGEKETIIVPRRGERPRSKDE